MLPFVLVVGGISPAVSAATYWTLDVKKFGVGFSVAFCLLGGIPLLSGLRRS